MTSLTSLLPLVSRAGSAARSCVLAGAATAAFAAGSAFAQGPAPAQVQAPAQTAAQVALPPVDAEVRRIDTAQQKLTLRHAEIPNLQMGAMTMVFRVRDPAWLDGLRPGDPVRVTVEQVDGALVVQSLEARP